VSDAWEAGRPGSRGRVLAAVAVLVVLAVLLAGRVTHGVDPTGLAVDAAEDPLPAPRTDPRVAVEAPVGSWRSLALAPLRARSHHHAVWSGREMIVWGGQTPDGRPLTDGAAYDPQQDRWRRIPPWWRDGGRPATALWVGAEMILVGETAAAAYHPVHDRWRWLPAPPEGQWAWKSAGVARGELVVLAHSAYGESPRRAIAYLPTTDTWRELPEPPVDGWEASSSVTVDDTLVVAGLYSNGAALARYHPADDAWSEPDLAPPSGWWVPHLSPAGADVIVSGRSGTWRWTGDDWLTLPGLPPALLRAGEPTLAWTGEALIAWGGDSPRNGVVLSDGEWRQMLPMPTPVRRGSSAVWTGAELLVWGGETRDGAAFTVDTEPGWSHAPVPTDTPVLDGTWRVLVDVPLARDNPSLVWTGAELLVWGGAEGQPTSSGAAYDPDADTWREMEDAPAAVQQQAVWTGREMIVWDGAAYDPVSDAWRMLPPAPVEQLGTTKALWTGREVVVVTGPADKVAAAYDPAADTWRRLPDLPRTGNLTGAVWTGEEIVVVTDALVGTVLRFDGTEWRFAADLDGPRATYGMEVGWTGREVIVWGGAVDVGMRQGYAYDPAADAWRELPRPWFAGTLVSAQAPWTGTHLVVSGETRAGRSFGAYRPDEDRWFALPTPPSGPLLDGPMAWTGSELVVWSMHGPPLAFRPDGALRR
jgi:hypothetical protein